MALTDAPPVPVKLRERNLPSPRLVLNRDAEFSSNPLDVVHVEIRERVRPSISLVHGEVQGGRAVP